MRLFRTTRIGYFIRSRRLTIIIFISAIFYLSLKWNSNSIKARSKEIGVKVEASKKEDFITDLTSTIKALQSSTNQIVYEEPTTEEIITTKITEIPTTTILETSTKDDDLIDWHDNKAMKKEAERDSSAPGERGAPYSGPSNAAIKEKINSGIRQYGFNSWASDQIALDRSIRDLRHHECIRVKYRRKLPTVSVVIPIRSELMSTLMRTVISVINRSPHKLLREIILVDDANLKRPYLMAPKLDEYLAKKFESGPVQVRAVHSTERLGLIRARMMGARNATSEVVVFLDSHCEAGYNWLPPLIQPIAENYRTVTCPFIDSIQYSDFQFQPQDQGMRGVFDWNFYYKRLPKLEKDRKYPIRPFDSPVMAGGLFAINRKWFWELGGYDNGLEVWGAEQYELSFKIWQCHGTMVDVPCSRVGHVYKVGKMVQDEGPTPPNFSVDRNNKRVAEVWMDDYINYMYWRRPEMRKIDAGNLTEQHAVRKRLACHDFSWFLKHVAPDLVEEYPIVEPVPGASGQLSVTVPAAQSSEMSNQPPEKLCLTMKLYQNLQDQTTNTRLLLTPCHSNQKNQRFSYSFHNHIMANMTVGHRTDEHDISVGHRCLTFTKHPHTTNAKDFGLLEIVQCHYTFGNQFWKYHMNSGQIEKPPPYGQYWQDQFCLEADPLRKTVFLNKCIESESGESNSKSASAQRWTWSHVQPDQIEKLEKTLGEY